MSSEEFYNMFKGYKYVNRSMIFGEGIYGHKNGFGAALFQSNEAAIEAGGGLDQKVI